MTNIQLKRPRDVRIVGLVAGVLAFVVAETSILAGLTKWVVALAATGVAGLGLGYAQYVVERDSASEKRPIFESPATNVGWWALFYALVFHAPPRVAAEGAVGLILSAVITWRISPPRGGGYLHEVTANSLNNLGVLPEWLVVAAFVLVTVVSLALGGVDPRVRPSYWRSEYRSGKRDALGED